MQPFRRYRENNINSKSQSTSAQQSAATAPSTAVLSDTIKQRIPVLINADTISELHSRGYTVVDGLFGSSTTATPPSSSSSINPVTRLSTADDWSHQFGKEILSLKQYDIMLANNTALLDPTTGATKLLPKRNILEMETSFDDVRPLLPHLEALHWDTHMIDRFNELLSAHGVHHLRSQAIKVQLNTGSGGCFPLHYDAHFTDGSRRVLSSILYLNDNYDMARDGGALRLYPFPYAPVDIEPVADRWTIFSSPLMLHRVLPSTASQRLCLTVWFATDAPNTITSPPVFNPSTALIDATHAASSTTPALWPGMMEHQREQSELRWSALSYLLSPINRKHLSRLVYRDEWAQSLIDSHHDGNQRDTVVSSHHRDCDRIARAFQLPLTLVNGGGAAMINPGKASSSVPLQGGGLPLPLPIDEQFRTNWPDACKRIDSLVTWF